MRPTSLVESFVASEVSTEGVLPSKPVRVQPITTGNFIKPVATERKESYGKYRILKIAVIENCVVIKNGDNNRPNISSLVL